MRTSQPIERSKANRQMLAKRPAPTPRHAAPAAKPARKGGKALTLLVSLALVLAVGVGGLFAWIHSETPGLLNTFTPGSVTSEINEVFDQAVKSDVTVENTGNVPAFMRAVIVVTWVDEDDETVVSSVVPVSGVDYELTLADDGWTQGSDGLYYFEGAVAAGADTGVLIDEVQPIAAGPEGYVLCVDVVADAVQAKGGTVGASAVELAWGAEAANLVAGGE